MKAEETICILPYVPPDFDEEYRENDQKIPGGAGFLMLSTGDLEVEYLNDVLSGMGIPADDGVTESLFRITSPAKIGGFTCQQRMVARFGNEDIPGQGTMITGVIRQ